jgi:hypothetical protein
VFERDIFFRFDSVGARIRKSSGPKEPTWGADLDNTKHLSQANNFTTPSQSWMSSIRSQHRSSEAGLNFKRATREPRFVDHTKWVALG